MIYLQEIEENKETKTVIKKRVPSKGDALYGLKLYTVHTQAGVSLGDFDTRREARKFCNNPDRVMLVEALLIITKLITVYWNGTRNLKTDEYMHSVERDIERIHGEIYGS